MENKKESRKIGLLHIAGWIVGVLFVLGGISTLFKNFFAGILYLLAGLIIIPKFNELYGQYRKVSLSVPLRISLFFILIIISGYIQLNSKGAEQYGLSREKESAIVSYSFEDFKIICNKDATNLQKQEEFKRFKDKYIQWTGKVSSISESYGRYSTQIKHCSATFTSDILVTMKNDQKDILLKYKEGDIITYKAKLTRLGDILGLSADEGEVIETNPKEAEILKEELKSPLDNLLNSNEGKVLAEENKENYTKKINEIRQMVNKINCTNNIYKEEVKNSLEIVNMILSTNNLEDKDFEELITIIENANKLCINKDDINKEEFKFSPNSVVNTQNGISLSIDDIKYEIKGADYAKITEITESVLNKGNDVVYSKIYLYLWDENDNNERKSKEK